MAAFRISHFSIAREVLAAAGISVVDVPLAERLPRANDLANNVLPADVVARILLHFGHLAPGANTYTVFGVRCDCCNRLLTDPDSIAAGVGPTCQAA